MRDNFLILPDEDYFTLFPGESRTVDIQVQPRFAYGFDEYQTVDAEAQPDIRFLAFPDGEKTL